MPDGWPKQPCRQQRPSEKTKCVLLVFRRQQIRIWSATSLQERLPGAARNRPKTNDTISKYPSRHCTVTETAKQLNRHKSTISREIKRHCAQGRQYGAEKAQRQSRLAKRRKRKPYKLQRQHTDRRQGVRPCRYRKPLPIAGKDQKSALSALVERVTRHTIICKLKNLKAEDTARTAVRALKAHKVRVHTITMDNGKGFCRHTRTAEALAAETYFCRPYHSWEKGLNENTNGLIRQYFPKQTDFRNISDREIRRVQDELNHRPRKTLGYETPSVLFLNLFQPLVP